MYVFPLMSSLSTAAGNPRVSGGEVRIRADNGYAAVLFRDWLYPQGFSVQSGSDTAD
jgi:hypothetical protein